MGVWSDEGGLRVDGAGTSTQELYGVFYEAGLFERKRKKLEEQIKKAGWYTEQRYRGIPGYYPPMELRHKNLAVEFKPI